MMAKPPKHPEHGHRHPPYMMIFLWLTLLTAIEVFPVMTEIYFGWVPIPHHIWVPVLLIIALAKATLVALYYMHLRYDKSWLAILFLSPFFFAMLFGIVIVAR
ncbi:MAG: cytochrome C oxidase subunit IV family protein [Chloroflexaceae bacterium]|nr:cytochrome C oxidase subunit IV family protein [Chloroflexaceae bacterium]